jgi:hypothetical protein
MRQVLVILLVLIGLTSQPTLAQTPTPDNFPIVVSVRYGPQESQVYDITFSGVDESFQVLNHFDGSIWNSGRVPAQMGGEGQMLNGGLPTLGQQIIYRWQEGVLTLTTNKPEMLFEYESSIGHHGWLTGDGVTSLQLMTVEDSEFTANEAENFGMINITNNAGEILMGEEQTELRPNQPVPVRLTDQSNKPLEFTVTLKRDTNGRQGVLLSGNTFCFVSTDLIAVTLVQYQGCVASDKPTTLPLNTSLSLLITPPIQQ